MRLLDNYIAGQWIPAGPNPYSSSSTPCTADPVAAVRMRLTLTYGAACRLCAVHSVGRTSGRMTFQQRGLMLKALALHLMAQQGEVLSSGVPTRAPPAADAWIDVEGGIGTIVRLCQPAQAAARPPLLGGWRSCSPCPREGSFIGHHIGVPKRGVAVHINAYNFPDLGDAGERSVSTCWPACPPL